MSVLVDALAWLKDQVRPTLVYVADMPYATHAIHPPPAVHPETIAVSSLRGVVDFLKTESEDHGAVIVIDGPKAVRVVTAPDDYGRRGTLVKAEAAVADLSLNRFVDRETMHLQLLYGFQPGPDRDNLLRIIGNLVAGETRTIEDDGLSQEVVVKQNLAAMKRELVQPIWNLQPFSGFPEIEQVERPFVFRIREEQKGAFTAGLWAADGGLWRTVAVERIAEFLRAELAGFVIVK